MNKLLLLNFILIYFSALKAQTITMDFPQFSGKNYDFTIFQGDKQKTVYQGVIPSDGKFKLTIPKEYAPYTGMSRWLITGTKEGGGLNMFVPGKDFSVMCTTAQPKESDIIYKGNTEQGKFTELYKKQQEIFSRHDVMLQATKTFTAKDKNYSVFQQEYQNQVNHYNNFQADLNRNPDNVSQLLQIVNITQGIGTKIDVSEEEKAKNVADFIANQLDWNVLYTSGYWSDIIRAWASIHSGVLKNTGSFASDFKKITGKMNDKAMYTDFAGRTAYFLSQLGQDNFIAAIAPMVISSGKINDYKGSLSAYTHSAVGVTAPDLTIKEHIGPIEDHNHKIKTLKSNKLAGDEYQKTLLVFYESGCGPCENLLSQLPGNYPDLKAKGIRIIGISADKEMGTFQSKAKNFPWKDSYCDYEGITGVNFKNYGITGTPTMILIDKDGKVLLRTAALAEVLKI